MRRMVADLDVPIEIDVCPTVREADGLAMSSRNRLPLGRRATSGRLAISQSLQLAQAVGRRGHERRRAIRDRMREAARAAELRDRLRRAWPIPRRSSRSTWSIGPAVALIAAARGHDPA